ncbi:MAG: glycosyltransferase [Bacteroidia bacterium]
MTIILYIIIIVCILAVLHTYVIYPSFLKLVPQKTLIYEEEKLNAISVIMAAYNEEKVIGEKIQSILNSDYPMELVTVYVGSDASTDRTNEIVKSLSKKNANIKLVEFGGRSGKSAIINQLAEKSQDEILILTDANVIFDKQTIKNLNRHFIDTKVHQVAANICKISEKNIKIQGVEKKYIQRENHMKKAESDLWEIVIGAEGGCYAIRKNKYIPVPKNFFMDDFFITMGVLQNGGKVLFDHEAVCYEDVPSESQEEFKRKIRISIGNFQNLKTYKKLLWPFWKGLGFAFLSHKVLRWYTPFFLLILYFSSLILSYSSQLFLVFTLFQLILLASPILLRFNLNFKPALFIAHFYNMNYALLKGFIEFKKGVKSNIWQPTKRNA